MDSPFQDPLTHFGLDFIDAETGGLIRDKLYLLHGPSSPWKTAIALHFVHEGLRNDQRCAYVTSQDPEAVLVQAERFGIDLREYVPSERLVLLTYHPRISQHLESQNDWAPVLEELTALIGPEPVGRLVFDPVVPLIEQTHRAGILPATRLLIEGLQRLDATILCIVDDTEEPYLHVILKEFMFLSFGAFQLLEDTGGRHRFRFQKVIWNPRDYPDQILTLRSRYGVQVIEPVEGRPPEQPRLTLAQAPSGRMAGPDPVPLDRARRLLLLDDDEDYHTALETYLGPNCQVTWVRDPVEGLSRLLDTTYDVILANMSMPRMDSRELALRIRQHNATIPLIVYSDTLRRGTDGAEILRVGADMFLTRPLAFNYVKAAIDAVMRRPPTGERFPGTREYIDLIEAESRALRDIPRDDPETGLAATAYFETRIRYEIEKATSASYPFAVAGYHVRPLSASSPGLQDATRQALRECLRKADLVTEVKPHLYLAYLEECLLPGVARIDERLIEAIRQAIGGETFVFHSAVSRFPGDGRDYDTLVQGVLEKLGMGAPNLKRLS